MAQLSLNEQFLSQSTRAVLSEGYFDRDKVFLGGVLRAFAISFQLGDLAGIHIFGTDDLDRLEEHSNRALLRAMAKRNGEKPIVNPPFQMASGRSVLSFLVDLSWFNDLSSLKRTALIPTGIQVNDTEYNPYPGLGTPRDEIRPIFPAHLLRIRSQIAFSGSQEPQHSPAAIEAYPLVYYTGNQPSGLLIPEAVN